MVPRTFFMLRAIVHRHVHNYHKILHRLHSLRLLAIIQWGIAVGRRLILLQYQWGV